MKFPDLYGKVIFPNGEGLGKMTFLYRTGKFIQFLAKKKKQF